MHSHRFLKYISARFHLKIDKFDLVMRLVNQANFECPSFKICKLNGAVMIK